MLLFASPAFAEGGSLADSLTGIAKAEYVAGKTLFDDGDFGGALVKFKSALEASKDNRLLWNLGASERGLRHYAQAIRYFERYKAEAASTITDKDRAEADAVISGLRPYVAAVTVRANEPGASVVLDGEEVGKTPLEKYLVDLGEHRLVLKKQGFTDYQGPLVVNGTADLVLELRVEPAAHQGRIAIHAAPGDAISLDGKAVAVGEYEATVASGEHVVRVTADGKKPYEMRVLIADDQLRSVDVSLENKQGLLPTWAWITIGAAAVTGVSIGTYFALKKSDEAPGPVQGTIPPYTVQIPSLRFR